eukprot:854492-Prorocentrum_minimum.AAC.3
MAQPKVVEYELLESSDSRTHTRNEERVESIATHQHARCTIFDAELACGIQTNTLLAPSLALGLSSVGLALPADREITTSEL